MNKTPASAQTTPDILCERNQVTRMAVESLRAMSLDNNFDKPRLIEMADPSTWNDCGIGKPTVDMSFHWGYSKNNGPSIWGDHWPVAKNPKFGQSPINIDTSKAILKSDWPDPVFNYNSVKCKTITNNGHSCQVDVEGVAQDDKDDWTFQKGPLHHSYKLVQFHFHWGIDDNCGSEHTVDGKEYPLEVHLVHFNRDIYKNVGDAIDKPGGMMVLGVLFKIGERNEKLQKLIDHFDNIIYSGQTDELSEGFNPEWLLPQDRSKYWHYYGSLTTPPLHESVNWIVFHETQHVSPDQLVQFRKLRNHPKDGAPEGDFDGLLVNNFRPPQDKDFLTKDKNGQSKKVTRQLFTTSK